MSFSFPIIAMVAKKITPTPAIFENVINSLFNNEKSLTSLINKTNIKETQKNAAQNPITRAPPKQKCQKTQV